MCRPSDFPPYVHFPWNEKCDQYNWSHRAYCTQDAVRKVTFNDPYDVWYVCKGHMLNIGKAMSLGMLKSIVNVERIG